MAYNQGGFNNDTFNPYIRINQPNQQHNEQELIPPIYYETSDQFLSGLRKKQPIFSIGTSLKKDIYSDERFYNFNFAAYIMITEFSTITNNEYGVKIHEGLMMMVGMLNAKIIRIQQNQQKINSMKRRIDVEKEKRLLILEDERNIFSRKTLNILEFHLKRNKEMEQEFSNPSPIKQKTIFVNHLNVPNRVSPSTRPTLLTPKQEPKEIVWLNGNDVKKSTEIGDPFPSFESIIGKNEDDLMNYCFKMIKCHKQFTKTSKLYPKRNDDPIYAPKFHGLIKGRRNILVIVMSQYHLYGLFTEDPVPEEAGCWQPEVSYIFEFVKNREVLNPPTRYTNSMKKAYSFGDSVESALVFFNNALKVERNVVTFFLKTNFLEDHRGNSNGNCGTNLYREELKKFVVCQLEE